MAGISIKTFAGIAPKISKKLLGEGMAQLANNCRLLSGGLRSYSALLQVSTNTLKTGTIKTIFRMKDGAYDRWLSWLTDVNCVRGQIDGDTSQRIYWTGDNEPRISNLALASSGGGVMPASWYVLGVPAPLVAPTVTPSGGTGAAVSRAYAETFVTAWGEQSAPSPVSAVITGKVDDTWALTALNAVPINTSSISAAAYASGIVTVTTASTKYLRAGEQVSIVGVVGMTDLNNTFLIASVIDDTHFTVNLTTAQTYTSGGNWTRVAPHNTSGMRRRIYRTLNGKYFLVADIDAATTTYNDTVADSALGEAIPSIGYAMPPVTLKGLTNLPNGSMVGFNGFDVYFCEPWQPHAWPVKYVLSSAYEIVAIGVFGSSVVVGTRGKPYLINGSHPSNMSMEKTEESAPCVSPLGMVDIGSGVLYPSNEGMPFVGIGGIRMMTEQLFSRDEWQPLFPETMRCNFHNGMVFCWHAQSADLSTGFVFNPSTGAFAPLSVDSTASYVDPETNKLYVVSGGALYQWDAHPYNDINYDWKSRAYYFNRPVNLGYAILDSDYSAASLINAAVAADLAYNTSILASGITRGMLDDNMLDEYALDGSMLVGGSLTEYTSQSVRLTIYADGVERYSKPVVSGKAFSLPSGFKAYTWEFKISGNQEVFSLAVAETATELRGLA